ncbi:MAG: hypothetical protein NVSMB52_18810 [Chloroflexota bacterium]
MRMVTGALHEIGWHISTCSDESKAFEFVVNEKPDVVLLDISMDTPTSGWRVLHMLRDNAATRDVPVIVFTSQIHQVEEREAWLLEHHISVLSKPFELEDLYDAVQEFKPPTPSPLSASHVKKSG